MLELFAASLASFVAAFVNSIAGGGGLVSVPILFALFPDLPPAVLFGTNKAAMVWGTAWAAGTYARSVRLAASTLAPALAAASAGGFLGAWLVTRVDGAVLRRFVPVMLTVTLAYTVWQRNFGDAHRPRFRQHQETIWATITALALGVYDGFFGPGTGSFFIFAFVKLLGFDFLHAAAGATLLNTATNAASLCLFAWTGNVRWEFVVPMAAANVIGSLVGTRVALKRGAPFIRVMFIVIVSALILKTAADAYFRPA